MGTKIQIMSRDGAEKLIEKGFPGETAVISFYTPVSKKTPWDMGALDYRGKCERIFYVSIHDIDVEILSDYGLDFDSYFPEANELAGFIKESVEMGYGLICQCEYGQSRSAACAAAIKEFYEGKGIEIFADYRYYPNQLIFNKLLCALKGEKALPPTHLENK